MKIAMISSECVPFAKTGGLADVVGALPKALGRLGHEVIVILPFYGSIDYQKNRLSPFMTQIGVQMGHLVQWCAAHKAVGDGDYSVYFIEYNNYFKRDGFYHDAWQNDYPDNPERFAFFSRAALQLLRDMHWAPDIVHAHDWQTAPAMVYIKALAGDEPLLADAAGILTIHNMAYQGSFGPEYLAYTGLERGRLNPDLFEKNGGLNFLKAGIQFADRVNTVSPTYARETRSGPLSYGMAPALSSKGGHYTGILNGVDYTLWSPEKDRYLPTNYSAKEMAGKIAVKKHLRQSFHLAVNETTPVVGIISRFVDQKGLDVVAQAIETMVRDMAVQFAVLGAGENALERYYGNLPNLYPGRIGAYIGYSEEWSHLIEGGSDFFLMPSRYEPCGLNQIYSLRYGTLPIVRATGGLDDTVEQYDEKRGSGTGFKFHDLTPAAVYNTVGWAVSTWHDRPLHIAAMQRAAMAKRFGWKESARQYVVLYERALSDLGRAMPPQAVAAAPE